MKVKIDLDLCQGHAVCIDEAPAVFELMESDMGYPNSHLKVQDISDDQKEKIQCAVKYCPNRAISIEE